MYPIIQVSPTFGIPTYYLVISITVVLSLFLVVRRTTKYDLSKTTALDLSLLIMVFGFIGGRLLHVIYESFDYYKDNPLRILYFWDGGFVYYGGAILAFAVSLLYLRIKARKELESYLDLFAPVMAFAYALGRAACLLAGCCYGRYCDLPWAIAGRHPAPLYAILWELGNLCLILGFEKSRKTGWKFFKAPGRIFYSWMILHGIGRLIMESFRDDFRGPSLGLSISSWISFVIIFAGICLLLKKPVSSRR